METTEAYRIVFNDLINNNLFIGNYDAKNGKEEFMYGIQTVMEYIAYKVSEETLFRFNDMFFDNMVKSEDRRK